MPILFAITVVAFVALLWAAVSTAQHIRRARRRKQMATDPANRRASFPASPNPETAPGKQQPTARVVPGQEVVVEPPPPPPVVSGFASVENPTAAAKPEVRFPLSSHRLRQAESQLAHFTAPPESTPQALPSKRPPTSVAPQRPYAPYFNENMGDLSDPIPSPRLRNRTRQR
jgi:hypothetical protein